jgi:hypothetical protein
LLLVVPATPARADSCGIELNVSPRVGNMPLTVHAYAIAWGWAPALEIDMGGQRSFRQDFPWDASAGVCRIGYGFGADHVFTCPGTYEIRAADPDDSWAAMTTTITVLAPPGFALIAFPGDTHEQAYVATYWTVSQRPFTYSTVDWGDGTSETFTWSLRGLYAGTPNHSYAQDGEYTVTVTHHYAGEYCTWGQKEKITIGIPFTTTATRPATWGRVKSLYR